MMQPPIPAGGATPALQETDASPAVLVGPEEGGKLRVCFITTEFHGLFKNGGIGTANTGLALALAGAGFDVTVAFADADEHGPRVKVGNFAELKTEFSQSGINLDFVPACPNIARPFDDPRSASYCVYLYLKQHPFDVVYFNDCGGHGFYSLLAKHTGVFPNTPRMYVVAHGPQEWVLELNSLRCWSRAPVITAFLEQRSAELADALISPSQYLIDWMNAHDWTLPREVKVIQNLVPLPESIGPRAASSTAASISEIVFFGRLEKRKGIELFCDAIDLLNQSAELSGIRIAFMGKFAQIAGLHSGVYAIERARQWRASIRILSTYGQEEALAYLMRPGVLAVIPSHAENSPCVVAECIQLGVPFIATNRGGTVELVALEDREHCLIGLDPQELATKLTGIIQRGHHPARGANSPAEMLNRWLGLTRSKAPESNGDKARPPSHPQAKALNNGAQAQPTVSVCITSPGLSPAAEPFIESLLDQRYPGLELIVFDETGEGDRSSSGLSEALADREHGSLRILTGVPADRGAQRNAAAAQAKGDYLFFAEESNVTLMPDCIGTLVSVALRTGADIVTAVPSLLHREVAEARNGRLGYFPIGGCVELGAVENCFGGGAFLVARRSFERSGGFQASCEPEVQDWLFLAGCAMSGLSIEVVPEPAFAYKRLRGFGLDRSKDVENHRRILDAYAGQKVSVVRHLIEAAVHVESAHMEILLNLPEGLSGEAREIALRISSSYEPNSEESLRGFLQFCIERQKIEEALEFALYNGRSLLSDVVGLAKLKGEKIALDAVRRHTLDLWHEVSLTDDARQRVKSAGAFPATNFAPSHDGVASHSLEPGVTVLKAAAVCPPGTRYVRAVANIESLGNPSLFLALVVSSANARLRLTEDDLESKDTFWWTDWRSPAEGIGCMELQLPIPDPPGEVCDIHFLCKVADDASSFEGRVTWKSVSAAFVVDGTSTESSIEPAERTTPIPQSIIDRGTLLTDSSEFPFPVFVPGDKTLLHPLPGRVVTARFEGAVPPGSTGVRSVVSLELAEAHPVQFAAWIRPSSNPAASAEDFTPADAFSGWFSVRDKFRQHSFTVRMREPANEAMDLYLGTRVVESPDVHYCHAVWHSLHTLQ
jgi:glycosyltransferase involved in cell wall biosynthesis